MFSSLRWVSSLSTRCEELAIHNDPHASSGKGRHAPCGRPVPSPGRELAGGQVFRLGFAIPAGSAPRSALSTAIPLGRARSVSRRLLLTGRTFDDESGLTGVDRSLELVESQVVVDAEPGPQQHAAEGEGAPDFCASSRGGVSAKRMPRATVLTSPKVNPANIVISATSRRFGVIAFAASGAPALISLSR